MLHCPAGVAWLQIRLPNQPQYLAIERAVEFRGEFEDGAMFAVSGGWLRHAQLQSNIAGELHGALKGAGFLRR